MKEIDCVLFNLAREFVHKDNVVWDVGANVGLFAFSAAYLAGANGLVVALEPDEWLVQLLRRSSRAQSPVCAPVHAVPAAVAEAVDLRTFHIAARSRATNSLKGYGSTQTGGVAEEQIVVTVTLDWLSERYALPDVLKIDVEGAELEVLRGAEVLLERKRPIVLCETSGETSSEVTKLLLKKGYRIYNGEIPKGERKELRAAPWTTIALPI
ncbi:MAG TPA: FkbM family methyltransferase [Blastocatellia bacterium]|nr:FkbM family methyltransferase [Blastocatellia bacterium]